MDPAVNQETPDHLPAKFLDRLQRIVPEGLYDEVVERLAPRRLTSCRINTLLQSPESALVALNSEGINPQPVSWCDHALVVPSETRSALTRSALATGGGIYIQNLSSILASLVLRPLPGEQVLDLAAAPGGKAAHLAALMENRGWLSVVEPVRSRMFTLVENLKRAGVTIAHTYQMDGRDAGRKVPGRFDRVLLDAPCSGEARFDRTDPASWRMWSLRKIAEQSRKQRGLIRSGFLALREGGRMLYCTCSFAPEENEAIVNGLLEEFPGEAAIVPLELPAPRVQPGIVQFEGASFSEDLRGAARVLPAEGFDGFFMAMIARN